MSGRDRAPTVAAGKKKKKIFFYCCAVHFDNIKIIFTKECTLY
jgi:hypothetical protein